MSIVTEQYLSTVSDTLQKCNQLDLDTLCNYILSHDLILTCGNGGSAATALHLASDLRSLGLIAFDMLSPAKLTQLVNDVGPAASFNCQCIWNALVIAFSCSGTSENIERLFYQEQSDLVIITSTMKKGERVWDKHGGLGALVIEVDSDDYEIIEDCHLAICHAIKKELKERLAK